MSEEKNIAKFTQYNNDMYWEKLLLLEVNNKYEFFRLEWKGYNDSNWWNNVAPNQRKRDFIGDKGTRKTFKIDFISCEIKEVLNND